MDFHNKKIGIWGFGIVGKAALKFFRSHEIPITVMDNKELSKQDYELLDTAKSNFVPQVNCNEFLSNNDLILASPGIDLRPFASYKEKFITELDIFSSHTKKPIIAITGTIGKTTVTHFLSKILQKHTTVQTGGNIGTGMLELLAQQDHEITLLEVSSFQLEPCQIFAPDLAIWTNLYPNHLDRHTTIEDYFSAKCAILAKQKNNQQALIPIELASRIIQRNYQGVLHFFSQKPPNISHLQWLPKNSNLFWLENNSLMLYKNNQTQALGTIDTSSYDIFPTNLLITAATLYLLGTPLSLFTSDDIPQLEHRIEKVASYNGTDIYNDSKATIMESTIAAIDKLKSKPIILFLGGLSKGVDRSSIIAQLHGKVKHILCFGAEAQTLHQAAQQNNIESSSFETLEDAVNFVLTHTQPGDHILFSPGGSSYDLYTDYTKRGEHFKNLIKSFIS